ncbi:MAG: urea ABC transporter permease subunit UrtB [Pseudomonadales bacterium]|jgi:urea transport system permease protein|nr:urea ABC transporter permease subunit UrtB [Pseudomonadales bacterium]
MSFDRRGGGPARAGALLLLSVLLAGLALPASAALSRAQVDALAQRNLRAVEAAVAELAATGEPRARVVLEALGDGRLARTAEGRALLRETEGGTLRDPLDGTEVDVTSVREIRVSNRIRRALAAALAELSLGDPDASVRLVAARQFLSAPESSLLGALERAREGEADGRVAVALDQAIAATILADDDRPEQDRLAAIADLEEAGTAAARSRLLAADFAVDSRLDLRRREAVMVIDRILERWAIAQNLWYGLSMGSVLLLAALGLAITFGVMRVINMAHGEMIMLGAYTTYVTQQLFRELAPEFFGASLLLALPLAFAVAGATGMLIERTVIRRLYGRPLETLLATWGISLILQQLVRTIFGASNRPVEAVDWMAGAFQLGQLTITWNRLWILCFALAVVAAVAAVLRRTPLGLQIRAVTQNRAMAEEMGIRSERVDMVTFGLGSGIAGIAGVALSQIENVSPNLGQAYIIDSFMVIVFGGVGNLLGTLCGAMALGLANKFVEPALGAVAAKVLVLAFIIGFIQFRPQGLFPQRGRVVD